MMSNMTTTNPNEQGQIITPAQQPPPKLTQIKQALERARADLVRAAPAHLSVDRMIKVVGLAMAKSPALLACGQVSLLRAVMDATELGLEPNTPLGLSYLVPFKAECQLVIGYRGMIHLARQSGAVKSLRARVVRERDRFEVKLGLHEDLIHEPAYGDAGPMIAVYAVAELGEGDVQFEVMTRAQIDAIRDRSRAQSGPWVTDYEEMARKTVVKRLCKYLPLSIERGASLAQAIAVDDAPEMVAEYEGGDEYPVEAQQAPPPQAPPSPPPQAPVQTPVQTRLPDTKGRRVAVAQRAPEPPKPDSGAAMAGLLAELEGVTTPAECDAWANARSRQIADLTDSDRREVSSTLRAHRAALSAPREPGSDG